MFHDDVSEDGEAIDDGNDCEDGDEDEEDDEDNDDGDQQQRDNNDETADDTHARPRRLSDLRTPDKVKPIPDSSSLFVFSPTNR